MFKATELTKSGDLAGATAVIQAALAAKRVPISRLASDVHPSSTVDRGRWDPQWRHAEQEEVQDAEIVDDGYEAPDNRLPFGMLIDHLAARKKSRGVVDMPVAPGSSFDQHHFKCESGERTYYLFRPAATPQGIRGLVLMLHGCTQSPIDFALGTQMNDLASKHGLLVAYPEQTRTDNVSLCWNWFRPGDQRRGAGEPQLLAGLVRELQLEYRLDRQSTFAAGLSAGASMAAILGASYPEVFSAVGIHSGVDYAAAHDAASAFAAMRGQSGGARINSATSGIRTILFHGTKDAVVHPSNADALRDAALGGRATYKIRSEAVDVNGRAATRVDYIDTAGKTQVQDWRIEGAGHLWSGGNSKGSHTDASGPHASDAMVQFFLGDLGN